MAKKFMFVCFGILALAGAYAIGASNSVAQLGGSDVVHVYTGNNVTVAVTANGDFYARVGQLAQYGLGAEPSWGMSGSWIYKGNCFSGPVASDNSTLGDVKGLFR